MQREMDHDLVGVLLDGRYKVVRELGKGAMGTVYEGQHAAVGRRLAIKVLAREYSSTAARERFFHEARAAGAITHPHIVPVLDFGILDGGQPYMVMDYVEGESLEKVIDRDAPLPTEDAVEICSQVLAALEVIHGAGLVHRDIKPANIMLARVRRPRLFAMLLDFGVSRAMHAMWHRPNLTRVNEVLGTPAYFAPEQAGGGEVDPRWDLWAVGVMLYEMLTGDLPFRLESMGQVVSDLVNCRLIPMRRRNPGLPDWVYKIQERIHHPVRQKRYGSATAFLQALESRRAYLADEEVDAKTVPFLRVDLDTPPPEIMDQLAHPGSQKRQPSRDLSGPSALDDDDRTRESAPVFQSRVTDAGLPSRRRGELEIEAAQEAEKDHTVPLRRSAEDELRTSDVRPLPLERPRIEPRAAEPRGPSPWLPIGLSLLLLVAAGLAAYLAFSG